MKKIWVTITIFIGILLGAIMVGPIMSEVETPRYEVLDSERNIELRLYQPMIIAEVELSGARKPTIGEGFRLIADYIFGNNKAQLEINMTAPVNQQKKQIISMTAPVQQKMDGQSWKVSFIMPAKYTIDSLPKPNNSRIMLKKVPSKKFLVIRFSGSNSDANLRNHENKLMNYIKTKKIDTTGFPKYAFYNPPWTLPPLRRNEVMVEINSKS